MFAALRLPWLQNSCENAHCFCLRVLVPVENATDCLPHENADNILTFLECLGMLWIAFGFGWWGVLEDTLAYP